MRKQSKEPISKLQRKLWKLCREIALIQQRDKNGQVHCYTCNARNIEGGNRQLGHLWAKASLGAYLKYNLRVLKWQCARCNVWNGGMGADFYKKMLAEIGQEKMSELEKDRQKTVRAYEHYSQLLVEYTKLWKTLINQN